MSDQERYSAGAMRAAKELDGNLFGIGYPIEKSAEIISRETGDLALADHIVLLKNYVDYWYNTCKEAWRWRDQNATALDLMEIENRKLREALFEAAKALDVYVRVFGDHDAEIDHEKICAALSTPTEPKQ